MLDQFGFTTIDDWPGGEQEYVIHQLKTGSDAALAQLDAYLHPAADASPTGPQPELERISDGPTPWSTGGLRLFLSHTHDQAEDLSKLGRALAPHSIEAFVAHEVIPPASRWQDMIEHGLQTCDVLLAWLHPGFRESDWCDQEVGFAVSRRCRLLVIPVRQGIDPYGFIAQYQAITIRAGQTAKALAESIFELVLSHESSRGAMARALVWLGASRAAKATRTPVQILATFAGFHARPASQHSPRRPASRPSEIPRSEIYSFGTVSWGPPR